MNSCLAFSPESRDRTRDASSKYYSNEAAGGTDPRHEPPRSSQSFAVVRTRCVGLRLTTRLLSRRACGGMTHSTSNESLGLSTLCSVCARGTPAFWVAQPTDRTTAALMSRTRGRKRWQWPDRTSRCASGLIIEAFSVVLHGRPNRTRWRLPSTRGCAIFVPASTCR